MSPDGRFLAVVDFRRGEVYGLGLLDLRNGRLRTLPGRYRVDRQDAFELFQEAVAGFSPDSRELLVRSGKALLRVDMQSGASHVVASGFSWGPAGWLKDGRVAYLDARRRLVIGGHRTGFTARKLTYSYATWSPDGRYVLYAKNCAVWMLDLRKGTTRRLTTPGTVGFSSGAWSPDGRYFLLQQGGWDGGCTYFEDLGSNWSIRHADGRPAGFFAVGGWAAWSADSRSLLGFPYTTGTDVTKLFSLTAFDVRTRRGSTLLAGRFAGAAFLGRGGRLVYSRYLSISDRDGREWLYAAQLSPR